MTWMLCGLAFGAGFVTAAGLAMWQHVRGTYGHDCAYCRRVLGHEC